MKFEKIFDRVRNIQGFMGRSDCEALYNYTKDLKHASIVEIGAYSGISTIVMALSSPSSQITTIDCYLPWNSPNQDEIPAPKVVMKEFLKNTKKIKNIKLIYDKSENVNWVNPIDFLMIDGDHHYEGVVKDIEHFAPLVKKGHYIFFHDFEVGGANEDWSIPLSLSEDYGIKKALKELKDKYFSEVKMVSGFACCKKK